MADEVDDLGRVLNELEAEALANADTAHDKPDGGKFLYHYTDAAGFHGIVREQSLRATDYRFLNDRTEIKCGVDAVRDAAKEVAADQTLDDRHHHLMNELLKGYEQLKFTEVFNPFILSFSDDGGNELGQWRAYAGDGAGYSIGFDPELLPMPRHRESPLLQLVKCDYDGASIRERARQHLKHAVERYVAATAPVYRKGNHHRLYASFIKAALMGAGLLVGRMKDSAFKAENEYRIVVLPLPETAHEFIEYRVGRRGLIPFIPLRMELRYTLRHVWVGPTQDPARGKAVAEDFLGFRRPGLVRASEIPYTGR
jgi:hypothetical protein